MLTDNDSGGEKMKQGVLRQVLLITDGCSNKGENPISVAGMLREFGICVNVIGILNDNFHNEKDLLEIESIAVSGGGVHRLVYAHNLSQTVQMVTRKAMTQTIQGLINKELTHILGKEHKLEELPPSTRGEVIEVVDELSEKSDLELLILVDTSASMGNKIDKVREALFDLHLSLFSRIGQNEFKLFIFPGKNSEVEEMLDWTPNLQELSSTFNKLPSGGLTPTGPALRRALEEFEEKRQVRREERRDERFLEEWNI